MKQFTCREMGGPCDMAFSGMTADEIGKLGGEHIMNSTDDAHGPMREQMAASTEESKAAWWTTFRAQFDAKADA